MLLVNMREQQRDMDEREERELRELNSVLTDGFLCVCLCGGWIVYVVLEGMPTVFDF